MEKVLLAKLEADIEEIINYYVNNRLISGEKERVPYVIDNEIHYTYVYNRDSVIKAGKKLAAESKDFKVLKMLLKSKIPLVVFQIAYNPVIFENQRFFDLLLNHELDFTFDIYNNSHLPKHLIEERIDFMRKTYKNIPSVFFDRLFEKHDNTYVNSFRGRLGIVESEIKRVHQKLNNNINYVVVTDDFLRLNLDESFVQHLCNLINNRSSLTNPI